MLGLADLHDNPRVVVEFPIDLGHGCIAIFVEFDKLDDSG